jgi:Zn-finger nucleic acid-binding protein
LGSLPNNIFPNLALLSKSAALKCPDCLVAMLSFACGAHVVEKCPRCQGIWFSAKSFGYFRDTLREFDLTRVDILTPPIGRGSEPIHACPKCEEVLSLFHYSYNTKILLSKCPRCRGLWVPLAQIVSVISLAKVGQEIAPHVAGLTKEWTKMEADLQRSRQFTSAMNELKKPLSPWKFLTFWR